MTRARITEKFGRVAQMFDDIRDAILDVAVEVGKTLDALEAPAPTPTPAPTPAPLPSTNVIQSGRFRIELDLAVPSGAFWDGEPYVVGPVQVVSITPTPGPGHGRAFVNGYALNPNGNLNPQPFDSGMRYTDFAPPPALPILLQPGDSLVLTESDRDPGARPQLEDATVLTCVMAPPAGLRLRPGYCGERPRTFTTLDTTRLQNHPLPAGVTLQDAENTLAALTIGPWLDFRSNFYARYFHPGNIMPDYGRDMAAQLGRALLLVNCDIGEPLKSDLALAICQIGIDLWSIVESNGWKSNWQTPNGGHVQGRAMPMLFAAYVLGVEDWQSMWKPEWFGNENGQTFIVTQRHVERSAHRKLDARDEQIRVAYTANDVGMPEWGLALEDSIARFDRGEIDWYCANRHWDSIYRQCCTANSWHGHALAACMMGLRERWGHPAFFAYTKHYMRMQKVLGVEAWKRSWDSVSEKLWDAFAAGEGLA